MGLRQRAKDAWLADRRQRQQERVEAARRRLREDFGVRDEDMETFEAASIGMDWNDKTIRVDDLLFVVDDDGRLFVRDQLRKQPGNPWREVRNLVELGRFTHDPA